MRSILKLLQLFSILVALSYGQYYNDYNPSHDSRRPIPMGESFSEYLKYLPKTSNYKPIQVGNEKGADPRLMKSGPIQFGKEKGGYTRLIKSGPIQFGKEKGANPRLRKSGPIQFGKEKGAYPTLSKSGPIQFGKEKGAYPRLRKFGPVEADDYPSIGPSGKADDYHPSDLGKTNFNYAWSLDRLKSAPSPSFPRLRSVGIQRWLDDYRPLPSKANFKYNYIPDLLKSAPSASKPFQYPVANYPNYNLHKLYHYYKVPKSSDYNDDNANDMDNAVGEDVIENKIGIKKIVEKKEVGSEEDDDEYGYEYN